MQIVDADGHISEGSWAEEIGKHMPKGNRSRGSFFPTLDHLHGGFLRPEGGRAAGPKIGPDEWVQFLDDTGIDWTVIYPTSGLAMGRITSEDYAVTVCHAYNDWLHERFTGGNPRIRGMALIPVQDVPAAVEELHRAVTELGMCGAMLPSNGEGLKAHLGSKIYWPIYEEAEKLGCSLAVHGGSHHHLGLDTFSIYYPVNALGHPFGIMVQAAGMISHGVFERFPKLRVGYLEGGSTWVPFMMDRLDRAYHEGHAQVDMDGAIAYAPNSGEKPSDYFKRLVHDGRLFVGFDVDDDGLANSVDRAGGEAFLYASDFPHEVRTAQMCRGEIDELLEREDLSEAAKEAVLGKNAVRFYGDGPSA
ncbi:MAG: amidohydrolase [Chloroflexi bacterium]|nr:amidohydrolase [Chloroflexota bacterium]